MHSKNKACIHRPHMRLKDWLLVYYNWDRVYECRKCGCKIKLDSNRKLFYSILSWTQTIFIYTFFFWFVDAYLQEQISWLKSLMYWSKIGYFIIVLILVIPLVLLLCGVLPNIILACFFKFKEVNDK